MKICYVNKELLIKNEFHLDQEGEEGRKGGSKKLIKWLNDLSWNMSLCFLNAMRSHLSGMTSFLRQADHIVLLADATQSHQITQIEKKT